MPLSGFWARWWRNAATSAPRTVGVAFAGGVVAALSLPPWGWWPLGVVGLAVAAWALRDPATDDSSFWARFHAVSGGSRAQDPWRRRALVGLGFGLGMFLPGLWWVTEFHAVGYVVLTLLQTSFFVGAFTLSRRWWSFPGAVVLAEAARSAVPFGGLPLGGLALGQAGGPFVASARVGGALLVLGVVAALASAVAAPRRRAAIPVVVALAIAALGWVAPAGWSLDRGYEAALVQGGGPRGFRAVESDANEVFERHLRASERIPPGTDGVELVLWPENAIDVPQLEGSAVADELAAIAQRTGATVVAGVTEDADADRFVNAAVVWVANGKVVGRYDKVRRVPFGEYVPGRAFFEKLVDLSVLPRDAVAGRGDGWVQTPVGRVAIAISYEVFFSDRTRNGVRGGGVVVLVPTNAASFTTSQVPGQEVAAARLRAWETGRWVLQAAPTGYTAVIDHRGRVLRRSTLGRAEIVRAPFEQRVDFTWYVRYGDTPVVFVALVLVVLPWRLRVRVFRR